MAQIIASIHPKIRFLFRYSISGGVGAIIQLAADYVAVEFLNFHYQIGVVAGFCIALVVSFVLQKYWTFRERSGERFDQQMLLYIVIAAGSLGGNIGLMHLFVERFAVHYLVAQSTTIVIVVGISFLLNNFITFRHSSERLG